MTIKAEVCRGLGCTLVPFEEAQRESRFGAAYADYRASVQRWL